MVSPVWIEKNKGFTATLTWGFRNEIRKEIWKVSWRKNRPNLRENLGTDLWCRTTADPLSGFETEMKEDPPKETQSWVWQKGMSSYKRGRIEGDLADLLSSVQSLATLKENAITRPSCFSGKVSLSLARVLWSFYAYCSLYAFQLFSDILVI